MLRGPISVINQDTNLYVQQKNEHGNTLLEEVNVHIDWGGQSKTPVRSYPEQLLKIVAARFYIGSPNIGGKIINPSIVYGYTEITLNDSIYRCRSFFTNIGSWYDQAYFRWEGFDSSIPARLLMILDLSAYEIIYEVDIDQDQLSALSHVATIPHSINKKCIIIKAI